jgi:hypothetical protein
VKGKMKRYLLFIHYGVMDYDPFSKKTIPLYVREESYDSIEEAREALPAGTRGHVHDTSVQPSRIIDL